MGQTQQQTRRQQSRKKNSQFAWEISFSETVSVSNIVVGSVKPATKPKMTVLSVPTLIP